MPYKDIASFRRSYRAKKNTFAYERSHNLIRDYQTYTDYRQVLKDSSEFPKTLATFQEIKYNNTEKYQELKDFKAYKVGGGNYSFENYKLSQKLSNLHITGKINLPALKIDVEKLKFDDKHINQERAHNITLEEAKTFINHAKVSVTVWKGKYERYYSSEGVVYLDKETMTVRTAFKKDEFDERTKKIIESVEKNE